MPPRGYTAIEKTPKNYPADLNSESFNAAAMFLCVKRGRDKPPLTEIGVYYHPKDGGPPPDHEIVRKTPYGRLANVSNSSSMEVYLTYKRALRTAAANSPVVTDICVILGNKDESPPHAFIKIDKNLNRGLVSCKTCSVSVAFVLKIISFLSLSQRSQQTQNEFTKFAFK